MFNKPVKGKKRNEINFPIYMMYFYLTKWITEEEMTKKEKEDHPQYKTTGGYLKTLEYKEAWQEAWKKASKEEKEATKKLPNFNKKVFYEITGIKV